MSLHNKLSIFNSTQAGKTVSPTLKLPYLEATPYKEGKRIKWINIKKNNISLIDNDSLREVCSLIESKKITIDTASDVANLLEVPTGQLLHILYGGKDYYRTFEIKKKSGGVRVIKAPSSGLAILQERLKTIIELFYRPKKCAHGFIKGKSIITNAKMHVKKKFVVNMDLENYFESVTFPRVYGIFRSRPFNFSHPAATVLAQLCTHNGSLPQGASTSPLLANLASTSLDKKLTKLARSKNISYTRYADDITFSFNQSKVIEIIEEIDSENYKIGDLVNNIIISSGFNINYNKFRVQKRNNKQSVTGLVVNDKVNIDRKYIRITRSMIHRWKSDKIKYALIFVEEKGLEIKNNSHAIQVFRNHIYGRLSFIKMVRGGEYPGYLKLMSYMSHNDSIKTSEGLRAMKETENYDVFICHASEDKENIAIPIYEELSKINVSAFIDHVEIKWGDSLIEKINSALVKSKYVIAILSDKSVKKAWPLKELRAVLSREISGGDVKLLTLIKKADEEVVKNELPLLHDKLYMLYEDNPSYVACKIKELL